MLQVYHFPKTFNYSLRERIIFILRSHLLKDSKNKKVYIVNTHTINRLLVAIPWIYLIFYNQKSFYLHLFCDLKHPKSNIILNFDFC